MRTHIRPSVRRALSIAALGLALPILAWTSPFEQLNLQPESRLWVEGTSSIKSWSCRAGEVNASIEAAPNAVAQVAAGEKAVRTVKLSIPSEKLDCANGTMNEHMRKAIKASEFPTIDFRLTSYDVNKGATGPSGTINGTLTLGGVQKTISIPAQGKAENGALRVTGDYELKMTDYGLTPPSLMFGRIKVREGVTVKFDLLLKG